MSDHKIEVVPITLEKHPNADKLSLVKVGGYTVCVNTEAWQDKTKAAYIPPDSLVNTTHDEFSFLAPEAKYYYDSMKAPDILRNYPPVFARIKAKKIRGVVSYGMLAPVPKESNIGDDVTHVLGVYHYEPPIAGDTGGATISGPALLAPKYDIENFMKLADKMFEPGEKIKVTEKIHGANGRWVYHKNQFFCGSRTQWKRDDEGNMWWRALRAHPELSEWLIEHPDVIVYGEVYGQVQKGFSYGCQPGEVKIAVFDLFENGSWIDADAAKLASPNLPWVPDVPYDGGYDFDKLVALAEGKTILGNGIHIREGIVVKPIHERIHPRHGRVQLKIVSVAYYNS